MREWKAEIIAVGTELLLGQIANTNAQWISQQLADYGIHVYYHGVVGDNLERVKSVFEDANKRSDLIFVTGGLGPTDDDLTREAFAAITNKTIKEDTVTMDKIEQYFVKANRQMTPNNRKQAHVFEDAYVFQNPVGMAPGMYVETTTARWIFMPGVPREMKSLMTEGVLPYLKQQLQLNTVIKSRMLRFIGIGESQLEHDLKQIIDHQSNPTIAPLAQEGEVALRLSAKAANDQEANRLIDETEKEILNRVGQYFYGYDEVSIQQQLVNVLNAKSQSIAAAESLTGGKFVEGLVSIPGASSVVQGGVVCYAPSVKQNVLNVPKEILEQFGTVSQECANELARNVCSLLNATIGISFTGVAGPDKVEGKDVGRVHISIFHASGKLISEKFDFQGDREAIRTRTVKKGYELLYTFVKNL
ncbi:competence/damage-inducible protein A [Aquibacillus salsiterrae]|uniref:Putative competence-damage inducible protein n=1 Tax=Aquibacillus salsiterrae TaxID=2950439 RepID=A0A9X3WB97_9BACI|nr:competence/damage-inducible protein A [Aquibacillus salsiterrae]MDC3416330.1 competence/damage-inducible protein A [Aquibacillus salsiterrae]